ncbi:phytanoyl-CoA dioxygenase family protein [Sphingomonas sp. HMP6]|uniref:phytanoyl-CoA dioxygenase family protein n=1 Tax=Sphingomonas sp. HMP6 TaxID=1517551 RepID=UPI001E626C25|nr:phytanoyl-CoA dioxygenase family protein [Sphingomonas sp. HMP6]
MVQRPAAVARCAAGVRMVDWSSYESAGFAKLPQGRDEDALAEIEPLFVDLPAARAGHRLPRSKVAALTAIDTIRGVLACRIGASVRPVRALLFDKSASKNWALGWHQDRTIEVRARIAVPGFGPWTVKAGGHHVAPPISLLEAMVTARIHLDDVDTDNAPLLVAPGSHRLGLVPESDLAATVQRCGVTACLAERGDIWLYSTPILHASDAAAHPRHRRVLQVDFAAIDLPSGLHWADLV